MKKIALVLALACFAPIASAASSNVATFDFWAWVASMFETNADSKANSAPVEVSLANIDTALQLGPR